jgi:hypothetical protein
MPEISLLDRYLQFVANFLPSKGREDILAELRANLQAEIDDRAESLGHSLTNDEVAAILKQHGHPLAVATRYYPHPQLIGAPWIALYWLVLKISLAVAAAVALGIAIVSTLLPQHSVAEAWGPVFRFPETALIVFAWVTLTFATMDYFSAKFNWIEKSSWDPCKLPAIRLTGDGAASRQKPMSDFIGALIGLLIFAAVLRWAPFLPANISHTLRFSSAWKPFYEILLGVAIVNVVATFILLLRPDWYGIRPTTRLITTLASLAAFWIMLMGGPWVMVQQGGKYYPALGIANVIISWCVLGALIGYGIALVVNLWQCIKLLRKRGGNGAPAASLG